MNNLKIKIITGFRQEQYLVIEAEEAHKAYYLFLHPEERGVFSNGLALVGKNIQEIQPAYNETMGWNPSHQLDDDDWNDLRSKGIDSKLRDLLAEAKQIAYLAEKNPSILNKPLLEAKKLLLN
jgi:hypothetical protein